MGARPDRLITFLLIVTPIVVLAVPLGRFLYVWLTRKPYCPNWPFGHKVYLPTNPEWSSNLLLGIAMLTVGLFAYVVPLVCVWKAKRRRAAAFVPFTSSRRESLRFPRRYGRR